MKIQVPENHCCSIAASVAPEDVRRGDFVAVLSEIVELPNFLFGETLPCARGELVRIRRLPTEDRVPLKVKAICLPFVFVAFPTDRHETLDVRLASLVRLDREYAKIVWKALKMAAGQSPSASKSA